MAVFKDGHEFLDTSPFERWGLCSLPSNTGRCVAALTERAQGGEMCDFQSWVTEGRAETLAGPSSCPLEEPPDGIPVDSPS